MNTKLGLLKEKFGFSAFRFGQEKVIDNILDKKDVLGIMPTGAGKSICFQIPALMFSGISLVVSPLIALMKDQVEALNQNGIEAVCVNSVNTRGENRVILNNAKHGKYKIIYVTPERLQIDEFKDFANSVEISMVAVDEAHCVSQWGQDFRPSYLEIAPFIGSLEKRPVVAAFTATATQKVKTDIIKLLGLKDPFVIITGFNRTNLILEVKHIKNRFKELELLKFVKENYNESGIIYCATRKTVDKTEFMLSSKGYQVARYHAGLSEIERARNQDDFICDRKNIMVATNAFGMGIDKSNVRYVLHYNFPKNLENYYQEAGRAGRDGLISKCILFYTESDINLNKFFIEKSHNNCLTAEEQGLFIEQEYRNLNAIIGYCTTNDCLKKYILNYFGEQADPCGYCSNCKSEFQIIDFTVGAQKILSCVARMDQSYGIKLVTDVLKGRLNKRIIDLGFNLISTHGLFKEYTEEEIKSYIKELISKGYLRLYGNKYPVLKLTVKSKSVLNRHEQVNIKIKKKRIFSFRNSHSDENSVLYQNLIDLRRKLAKEQNVPAYIIFSDATARDICKQLPTDVEDLIYIIGIGNKKKEMYGSRIVEIVNDYLKRCKDLNIDIQNMYI